MSIRALIVDDEAPARKKIHRYLAGEPDFEILPDADGGRAAVDRILEDHPDLVFLDVQMPELDGFQVVELVPRDSLPQIVFTTAHDEFALRAFEVHALDYLLKPFDQTRFKKVLDRARTFIDRRETSRLTERVQKLLQEVRREKPVYLNRLLINQGERAFFLDVEQIGWIESNRNYLSLHVGKDSYSIRGTIEGLCARLDADQFVRINRSQAVNLNFVRELQPWFHGEFKVILKDGTEMSWSRRYLDRSSDLFVNRF